MLQLRRCLVSSKVHSSGEVSDRHETKDKCVERNECHIESTIVEPLLESREDTESNDHPNHTCHCDESAYLGRLTERHFR